MAELVDALVSGTSIRKDVQVRVLFQARLRSEKSELRRAKHTHNIFAQMVELVDTPA